MEGNVPPHILEAEMNVLGSVLIDNSVLQRLKDLISPESFHKTAHRQIWQAMELLAAAGETVNPTTLSEALRREGVLDEVGGAGYLLELAKQPAAYAEQYARVLAGTAALRNFASTPGAGAVAEGLPAQAPGPDHRFRNGEDVVHETFEHINELYEHQGMPSGVRTGFKELDQMVGGLEPGSLNIIAARPSMGKTAFALTIAQHVALKDGVPVGIFSLEMPATQLMMRMITAEARIDMNRLRQGQLSERDFQRIVDVAGRLAVAPIYVDDTPDLSLPELRARARHFHGQNKLGLIIVDYLQLMSGAAGSSSGESRQQEIAAISRGLKGLARELEVPVVAVSQLSRAVEGRPNKRPILSDLRESGSLEDDADLVLFIYRDEYYNPHSDKAGIAEIIIGKQRNGPTGVVALLFHAAHVRFMDPPREDI